MDMDAFRIAERRMHRFKRKTTSEVESPWERNPPDDSFNIAPDDSLKRKLDKRMFSSRCYENNYLDISTKRAAIKASASVVGLVTYSDDKKIFQGAGTIIKEDGTILTSAQLITCRTRKNVVATHLKVIVYLWDGKSYEARLSAHDFYYGIAVVKIREDISLLKPARLRHVDDCIKLPIHDNDEGFQLRTHLNAYNLVPGAKVIVLSRYVVKPYDLMAAPGEFGIKRIHGDFECKELFSTTCLITESGKGGPLVNEHGEVIGVTSYDLHFSPFIPINIALKWWKHCKKTGYVPLLKILMVGILMIECLLGVRMTFDVTL